MTVVGEIDKPLLCIEDAPWVCKAEFVAQSVCTSSCQELQRVYCGVTLPKSAVVIESSNVLTRMRKVLEIRLVKSHWELFNPTHVFLE